MKARILSLIGALALCLLAITEVGTAQAACPSNFCAQAREECLGGCPAPTSSASRRAAGRTVSVRSSARRRGRWAPAVFPATRAGERGGLGLQR